jgi:hypothetical protein
MTDDTTDEQYEYEVEGEVIKLIHGELPAVRWACGRCGEDAATIFYNPEDTEKLVECENCEAANLVRRGPAA